MAINLVKGQKINLEKDNGSKLEKFCVGCNWGAIVTESKQLFGLMNNKQVKDVDLDLSCIMVDANGQICDHIYSPLYRDDFLRSYGLPKGKLDSKDYALHHSGDDLAGDKDGDDGLDNEIITVDLTKVAPQVQQIFFFLNNCGKEDFSQIPYASIRMYEGTPSHVNSIFASYNVAAEPQFRNMLALVMGKLYRHNNAWKFGAIGDAFPDHNIGETIGRIVNIYAK
ncbi:MAG: TerD family protein [Desulfovibrionaceae bacterium]|nr:TerD family protein [Desulfovibrionaceae bacterium]